MTLERSSALLCADCPDLRFSGKLADLEALSSGDARPLRPLFNLETQRRILAMPAPTHQSALVIGANGFIGSHLVSRLTRMPDMRQVLAMVRATPEQTAEERLRETFAHYKVEEPNWAKLRILEASPVLPHFGLADEAYRHLTEEVDQVFNAASSSDYSVRYLDLRDDWVLGLLRVLQFTLDGRRKHLTYLGSVGAYFYQRTEDFHRPDSWWYSGYCQMKWVNRQLLGWLIKEPLFSVTLCEAPYVLGATTEGLDPGRQYYSWWRVLEIAKTVGYIWDGPGMNYVPVDILADVLATNATAERPADTLLPCTSVPYDNHLLGELLGVKVVGWDTFMEKVKQRLSPVRYRTLLSSNVANLIEKSNGPSLLPPGYDTASWSNHRDLYSNYLSKVKLHDLRSHESPLVEAVQ